MDPDSDERVREYLEKFSKMSEEDRTIRLILAMRFLQAIILQDVEESLSGIRIEAPKQIEQ